ncbi:MAG: hypothetical protein COA42_23400 [Alteromonadaceae bacterium]|nr:MAG: hypothetical protein COA42_23400 [Alteromonadaceae bacterium]
MAKTHPPQMNGSPLHCVYTQDSVASLLDSNFTLAVFTFNGQTFNGQTESAGAGVSSQNDDPRLVNTGLARKDGCGTNEVWRSEKPVVSGTDDGVNWSENGELLFCAVEITESNYDGCTAASEAGYTKILTFLAQKNFPHIVRMWNYLADINNDENGLERYKAFCSGRYNAFTQRYTEDQFPAACAIGHYGGALVIYLIASKVPGTHYENPDQISAYQYPPTYGVRSPSFARATVKSFADTTYIYVSGTASIKGHKTLHAGDVGRQLDVTFDNIDRLLLSIAGKERISGTLNFDILKIYVRDPSDVDFVKSIASKHYQESQFQILLGDICRSDLGVEIEGMCVIASDNVDGVSTDDEKDLP